MVVNIYAQRMLETGDAARTVEAYLTAIKGFTKWLAQNYKLPRDPLASVKKPNPKADRRRERRMLLPDEWHWLRSAIPANSERSKVDPSDRVLLYETAIQTGLRSAELRSLTRGRLVLDPERPYITCKAGSTKNSKMARQYIQPDLAARLVAYVATKAPQAPVFDMPHEADVADMIRADLLDARRAWLKAAKHDPEEYTRREQSDFLTDKNHEGEVFDFHSLRHTCGAWLAMAGVHPKVVQTVMRHSSITLTMDTYGHLFPGQEADAVRQMGDLLNEIPDALQATGTDDASTRSAGRSAENAKQCVRRATGHDARTDDGRLKESPKPVRIADLGRWIAKECSTMRGRWSLTRFSDF